MSKMNIAVFASGGGSNFQSLLDKQVSGELKVSVTLFLTNNSKCGAADKARQANIPVIHMSAKTHPIDSELAATMLQSLREAKVDMIVLAGYMKKLPDIVLAQFAHKVLNIHPALLPSFGGQGMYGMHVHEAVYAYGAKQSGITVHMVDPEYDTGPVVLQKAVDISSCKNPAEIQQAVLALEHKFYWQVVQAFSEGRVLQVDRQINLQGL
jgi:phosphoribosylglycinamide formyltransferase-1